MCLFVSFYSFLCLSVHHNFLLHVSFSVSFQGTGLVEGLLANWTREGSGTRVDSLVAVEVGQVGEVLATGAENVRHNIDFLNKKVLKS